MAHGYEAGPLLEGPPLTNRHDPQELPASLLILLSLPPPPSSLPFTRFCFAFVLHSPVMRLSLESSAHTPQGKKKRKLRSLTNSTTITLDGTFVSAKSPNTMNKARRPIYANGPALLLLVACLLLLGSASTHAKGDKVTIDCNYCQGRGFPYVCNVSMESGICFVNSGDMRCHGEEGCQCCRTASAAGCTLCSMEADWDLYDDDEADI
jgi:hypothetical protein